LFTAIFDSFRNGKNWFSVTVSTRWFGLTVSGFFVIAFNFVSRRTFASFAHWDVWSVDFPFFTDGVSFGGTRWVSKFTLAVTNWSDFKHVIPAVESGTALVTVKGFTWSDSLSLGSTSEGTRTFSWFDTSFKIVENLTSWTLDWFFIVANIDAVVMIVHAFSPVEAHMVTSISAFESTKVKFSSFTFTWWSWSDNWFMWGMFPFGWDFWGAWWNWTWETNASFSAFHTIARLATIGRYFFSFGILDTFDFSTVTGIDFNTFRTIFRENGVIDTLATFNAYLDAFFFNDFPFSHVVTGSWARRYTWVVFSATIALHWAKSLMPPGDKDTSFVTSLSISSNSSTKTFTFTTSVTSTGIVFTVFKVPRWVDMSVACFEDFRVDNTTSFRRPGLPVWVQSTSVVDDRFFNGTSLGFPPRFGERNNVSGGNVLPVNKVVDFRFVIVTTKTFDSIGSKFWVEFDDHMGTFVPHEGNTNFSFNKDPKSSEFKVESRVTFSGDWSSSDKFDRRITDGKGDVFSAYGTFGTAFGVRSSDFKYTGNFSVKVFTFTSEHVFMSIKGFDVGVTINLTLSVAVLFSARPVTVSEASAFVASSFV
jgi:hypothetical protein